MMNYELAFNEDGEPFPVPDTVAGWRVHRSLDGRGRPKLVHARGPEKGKPLVLRANASHAELLTAAGPGKYKLEAVDEHWHKVDGIPMACTGPLSADEDPSDDDSSMEMVGGIPIRPMSYESVICHMVTSQTKMVEKALGQLGAVMTGVAELLNAAHNAGITSRVPPPPPPPPAALPVESEDDDEAEESEDEQAVPASGVSEVVQLIIKETVNKLVPLIFEKFTGGANGMAPGGLPLEAIFDWRKAVSNAAAAPSAPAAPAAPSAPAAPGAPMTSAPTAPSSRPTTVDPSPAVTAPPSPDAPAMAGAAPSRESPPGAAPAEMATPPAASSPRTHEEAAAMLNTHLLQVWQGLSPPERVRASQLVSRLAAEERTAWLAKLARLTVPEAIAHARVFLHAPPTPQLPTKPTQGEPS